ncbi:phosphate ABC transporter substrate-binding protein [Thalassotalea euphylliae]|uniref:Phosphate ABC transporter substrate-binding protein n=1 Tax=Thalassotalea euphylliae TaxID=1655234 RepID=A0A3E0UIK3_9GAMM|nr:phosphate ABC transporter substrate-binding protein [Thalassotalea euphylliae]REL36463.1 phosphate ABC transporter substrate-binding protein [Thalassotalea euphylliae]
MNKLKLLLLSSCFTAFSSQAVTVIVHPSNADALDKKAVKKIFLGKTKKFPNGDEAIPIDLKSGQLRGDFLKAVVGKSESQFKAYWSKLVFTGKGQAPRSVDSEAEIVDLISKNPNLIGYVSDGAVNDSVKSVGQF